MVENLILYGKSNSDIKNLSNMVEFISGLTDVSVIFMEDAVLGVVNHDQKELNQNISFKNLLAKNISLYYVNEDLIARGFQINNVRDEYQPLSYLELIDLIESSKRIISWL